MNPSPSGSPRDATSSPPHDGDDHRQRGRGELRSVAPAPISPTKDRDAARRISRNKSLNEQPSRSNSNSSPTKLPQDRINLFGFKRPQSPQAQRDKHVSGAASQFLSPPLSPRGAKTTVDSLPCPKSPLRINFRRKATKGPTKKKSRVKEEITEEYDENGILERTTITRIRNPDGTTTTEKHKERISPANPRYPKTKSIKARREADLHWQRER